MLSGMAQGSQGQHLASGDLLCVSLGSEAVEPQAAIRFPQSGRASSMCYSREAADSPRDRVTGRRWLYKSTDHMPDIYSGSLVFGRPSLPISERAMFWMSPPVTLMGPYLCVEEQNHCRNGKSAGVPGLKLLPPLANVFSVPRPDYAPLFTKARENLTVNSLRKGIP